MKPETFSYEDMMDIAGWMAAADCKRPIAELKEEAEVYIKTKLVARQPESVPPVQEGEDWVSRYDTLLTTRRMPDAINILVKEVVASVTAQGDILKWLEDLRNGEGDYIEFTNGNFYWSGDEDGDSPMNADEVHKIFEKSKQ